MIVDDGGIHYRRRKRPPSQRYVRRGDTFVRVMLSIAVVGLIASGYGAWAHYTRDDPASGGSSLPSSSGPDLVAIYVGSSTCHGSSMPGFRDVERRTMNRLGEYAIQHNMRFVKIGVSVDKSPIIGRRYLEGIGAFDAISVGDGWLNPVAISYLWRDNASDPALPQIVVVRRMVQLAADGPVVSRDTLLGRIVGIDGMAQWLASGEHP
jgi:hypothetical protein